MPEQLELGTYQTRNGRLVTLRSFEDREITLPDGSKKTFTYYRGTLFRADGTTPECDYEWLPTWLPNTIGEFVRVTNFVPAGQTNINDLVVKIAA